MKLSPKLNLPIPEGSDIHNLTNFVALLNAIDNNAASLGAMNDHTSNKNNPHAVTKTQVGLGQVNNVPQYSKVEVDSKLADLSKLTQLPANSVPSTGTPASFPIGITAMTVTSGDYPGVTTNSPGTLMTVRGSNDRGAYQLLSGNGTPQQRAYDGAAWSGWSTVATTASNVASASKLANARKIGGVNFDGTSDITLPGVNAPGNQSTSGKAATAGRADEATHADNATSANKLTTARKIGGVNFDGSADIALPGVNTAGNQDTSGRAATAGTADKVSDPTVVHAYSQPTFNNIKSTGTVSAQGVQLLASYPHIDFYKNSTDYFTSRIAEYIKGTLSVYTDNNGTLGTLQADTFQGNLSGKATSAGNADTAGSANKLTTARNINGVGFDGSSDITVNPVVQLITTAVDLFTLASGFYYFRNGYAVAPNKPASASNYFVVEVIQNATNGFMRLIDNHGLSFWTTKSDNIWAPWHQDADDATVVHNTGNETISGSKNFSDVLTASAGVKGDVTGSLHGNADTATQLAFKGTLADGADLDTIQTTGLYLWYGVTFKNGPVTKRSWGYMNVMVTSGIVTQVLHYDTSASIYYRVLAGYPLVWTAWAKVIFDNDKIANAAHADTADKLTTTRKIGGVSFDGTANINLPGVNAPGNQSTSGKAATAGKADEATHATKADSAITAEHLLNARSRELTDADRGSDTDNIFALTGTLNRTGNIVSFYANFQVKDAPTVSYSMLNAVKIPVGYRCSASAMPINIQQDTSKGNDQAIVAGDAILIQTHGANGLTFIGGMWITADDPV